MDCNCTRCSKRTESPTDVIGITSASLDTYMIIRGDASEEVEEIIDYLEGQKEQICEECMSVLFGIKVR